MKTLPSSLFTRSPASHLEDVFRGETILLTRYGRPFVLLSPPPQDVPEQTPDDPR